LGIEELKPMRVTPGAEEDVVGVLPMTGWREIEPFSEDLRAAVESNAEKLREATGLEGHLAVSVDRFDASAFPQLTEVPTLPEEISVLWVAHPWRHGEESQAVWAARRGDTSWRVHRLE
jgi:hypothetical protein